MAVKRGKGKRSHETGRGRGAAEPLSTRTVQRYGWIPDLPDQRDFTYAVPAQMAMAMPPSVDLRRKCPPVYDQGHLGSCTANAIGAALEYDMMKQKLHAFTPSRLFIYYNERFIEGTVPHDAGAMIRDGIKSVASQGACPEGNLGDPPPAWPYDISKFAQKPPPSCYQEARKLRAITYHSVTQNLADMKGCLAEEFPFVFGFTVYQSFESPAVARTGKVPMPRPGERVMGGHAVMAVGYDDARRVFICRNSWNRSWGDAGYFYMPYA
jgi:C1A family cysteine protease